MLYLDESQLHTHPHLAKVWQRPGERQIIPAAGVDRRLTIFGALEYRSGTLTTMIAKRACSATFQVFVETVVNRWPADTLVLVLDNASYHTSAALRHWLIEQEPRVTVVWLPTYSPNLNLIERVWRFVKSKLACHRFWNDQPNLVDFVQHLLDHTRATFAAPDMPHIRLVQNL